MYYEMLKMSDLMENNLVSHRIAISWVVIDQPSISSTFYAHFLYKILAPKITKLKLK